MVYERLLRCFEDFPWYPIAEPLLIPQLPELESNRIANQPTNVSELYWQCDGGQIRSTQIRTDLSRLIGDYDFAELQELRFIFDCNFIQHFSVKQDTHYDQIKHDNDRCFPVMPDTLRKLN
ncbi:MAG: hypothetical protein EZS28_016114 [Streblomastix strix]|uniref:Uncharacterized protein n=1 Tax=Streblomastix strix TaxID=222440 RepID=A0A5J4W1G1_9EUKA|nr:MAG: hypothetical protein EZS28_016114 [Streblomastix strix]